jgi:O-antigen ligase
MPENNNNTLLNTLLFALYLAFFISLVISLRAISSISIGLIVVTGFLKNKIEQKNFSSSNLKNNFFIFCGLFFLLQMASLSYTTNIHQGWNGIRLKSALVIIPLAICCCDYINEVTRPKILKWYCLILFSACVFAIYHASRTYSATGNPSVFLYHSLVLIYSGHAVQFSILVFIALLHLFEAITKKEMIFNRSIHLFLILFFLLFLFLLSSKLVIVFFILYFLYVMIKLLLLKSVNKKFITISIIGFMALSVLILFTRNPINNRFKEIMQTDFRLIEKEKFNPGIYFNGLQFRLLQWKFVSEILNEKKAWLAGISPGDAQDHLNQKYIVKDMYTGTVERGDKGFIGYNTHNQFLESLLQTGILGSLIFLLICGSLVKMAWQRKKAELSFVTMLLIIYSLSESVFETQYSLFIFLFLPLFFYSTKNRNHS